MEKEIHNHAWWLPYIEECRQRNIKIQDYCNEKGFNYDAFYWHWKVEKKKASSGSCENQIVPVMVTRRNQNLKHIEINGIEVCGSTDDLRDLLGIQV